MRLVFATNNLNKLKEVQEMLSGQIEILSLKDVGCFEEIEETAITLEGNAKLKADYITEHYGYDCFADDTGLEIDALDGAPGVYSARYAGNHRDANDNMNKVLENLEEQADRSAHFKTVIALHLKDKVYTFTGLCKGEVTAEKHGEKGFGYDPIFKPNGYQQTFAQMDLELKNQIGHRGRAVQQLVEFLNNY